MQIFEISSDVHIKSTRSFHQASRIAQIYPDVKYCNMENINLKFSPGGIPYTYAGREDVQTAQRLQDGETCKVTGVGNSMTPILKSHQPVICTPVTESTELSKRDIVMCKVNGHFYLHLIWSIRAAGTTSEMFLIGNNHKHPNGWINRKNIFGKVIEIC